MRKLLLLSLPLFLYGCSDMAQKGAINLAHSNYKAGDYRDTLEAIGRAERRGDMDPETKAELTYLKAQTYEKLSEYSKAKGLYEYLRDQHSESEYGYLAQQRLELGFY